MKTQIKFEVTVAYSEGKKHSIVETWRCSGDKALKKTLAQALGTAVDENGMPAEPDALLLEKSLGQYTDKEFIASELKRLTKAYKLYKKLIAGWIEQGGGLPVFGKIDPRTTITVEYVA